jgi:hypothetical protein
MSQAIHTRPLARNLSLLLALLAALAALAIPASPAHAHDELLGSTPAPNSTVEALPAELALTFSAEIADDPGASEVQVTDAAGTPLTGGDPVAQDNVLTQPLAGAASGAVTVLWKVVSSDGHPISGEFSFTITAAATPTASAAPTAEPTPTVEATPLETELPDDNQVDAGATLFANLLPVLIGAAIIAAVVALLLLASRRRRGSGAGTGAGSDSSAER